MGKKGLTFALLLVLAGPALAADEASRNPYYALYSRYYYQQYPKRRPAPYSYFNYYYYYRHRYGREVKSGSAYHYLYYYALDEKEGKPSLWTNPLSWLGIGR